MYNEAYGTTLKKIRLAKNLTQNYMSKNLISRSNYVKIETNQINTSFNNFSHLLDILDMTHEDFLIVHYGHSHNFKVVISDLINDISLFDFSYSQYRSLRFRCIEYSRENPKDKFYSDILKVLDVLITVANKSICNKKANFLFKEIWYRLEKMEDWYFIELSILRVLLLFFPKKQFNAISKECLSALKKYSSIYATRYDKLRLVFLSTIFLKKILFEEPFDIDKDSSEVISLCKKMGNYKYLGISYIQIGIYQFLHNNNELAYKYIVKGSNLLQLVEENDLLANLILFLKGFHNLDISYILNEKGVKQQFSLFTGK